MSILTGAIYDVLAGDATLAGLLATYGGNPAVFTTDPAPGDATLPYIVTAGEFSQAPCGHQDDAGPGPAAGRALLRRRAGQRGERGGHRRAGAGAVAPAGDDNPGIRLDPGGVLGADRG